MSPFRIGPLVFSRMEIAGSLGDLGTLLPMAAGMILLNGLAPTGLFAAVALFYILGGLYYRVPIAVQPMKTIGAYAIATAAPALEIQAAGLIMAALLLVFGLSNLIGLFARYVPKAVIRGVQASTGVLLGVKGAAFICGTSNFQLQNGGPEPFLAPQYIASIPLSVILGVLFGVLTLALLNNKRFPAGLVVVLAGLLTGLLLGREQPASSIAPGLYFPEFLPYGMPGWHTLSIALLAMVLPQAPMTFGNAVVANADLSHSYFPESKQRVTPRALCLSMGLANILSFLWGGMPMCHGAGGLAAHYRFGARTAGSNLIIGSIFLALALFLGPHAINAIHYLPMAVLGVLLLFAGLQLCLTITDTTDRKSLFTIFLMIATTQAANLGAAFLLALALHYTLLRKDITL